MEEKSRAKRYEDLRKSVEDTPNVETTHEKILQDLKNSTNTSNDSSYVPTHQKSSSEDVLKVKERIDNTDEFKNEYLDSFIQEVKEYNIQKGIRETEDTKMDILQQLSSKQRMKRAAYMEKMEQEDTNEAQEETQQNVFELPEEVRNSVYSQQEQPSQQEDVQDEYANEDKISSTQEIARQVQELLHDGPLTNTAEETVEEISQVEEPVVQEEIEATGSLPLPDLDALSEEELEAERSHLEYASREELLEQTVKLKVQLDEYEGELESLSTGVDKNNRLLNIIIAVLIIILLAVIGVVVYWLVSGGIL